LFAAAFGLLLGLALTKFGNPIILDRLIDPPSNIWEFLFQAWPIRWGYGLLGICAILGLSVFQPKTLIPKWVLLAPCLWLGWQLLSAAQTVDRRLTDPAMLHFAACVLCFFLGALALGRLPNLRPFCLFLVLAFTWVLWTGFDQHNGGLEAMRNMLLQQPNWQQFPPDYLKRIQSNRIFSTLVYPNALAAAILLLLPIVLVSGWMLLDRLTFIARAVIVGLIGYMAVACLYWSGSKSGWLIALVLLFCVLLRQPLPKGVRPTLLGLVLVGGLAGFFIKYSPYFHRGAPSVSARFEYWKAAAKTAAAHPVLGTGPATFSVMFRQIRPPEAEMAQLVHNDYLEQACDSGFPGLLAYGCFIFGSIYALGRNKAIVGRWDRFCVWLGLLGWTLENFVEFPLYIPALTWIAFTLFGWLWAQAVEGTPPAEPDRA
jgi:O-antigen ligase